MAALGFVKAVTEGGDHWLEFMPPKIGVRSGKRIGPCFSTFMDAALRSYTHDQQDAAHMRLCNDDDDVIRRIFLEGV